jgi:hypothetical protein
MKVGAEMALPFLFYVPNGEFNENVFGVLGRIAQFTYESSR